MKSPGSALRRKYAFFVRPNITHLRTRGVAKCGIRNETYSVNIYSVGRGCYGGIKDGIEGGI